jgi:hypothetical protein
MASQTGTDVNIVQLGHNAYTGVPLQDVKVSQAKLQQLLADPGKVDCPALQVSTCSSN